MKSFVLFALLALFLPQSTSALLPEPDYDSDLVECLQDSTGRWGTVLRHDLGYRPDHYLVNVSVLTRNGALTSAWMIDPGFRIELPDENTVSITWPEDGWYQYVRVRIWVIASPTSPPVESLQRALKTLQQAPAR